MSPCYSRYAYGCRGWRILKLEEDHRHPYLPHKKDRHTHFLVQQPHCN